MLVSTITKISEAFAVDSLHCDFRLEKIFAIDFTVVSINQNMRF
jgi:hypothetical protein